MSTAKAPPAPATEGRFTVDEAGSPNLAGASTAGVGPGVSAAPGPSPAEAPGYGAPAPEPWTPEEGAAFAAGLVSMTTGIYAMVAGIPYPVWEAHLRGDAGEFKASGPALARWAEAAIPRGFGGAPGLIADGTIVGSDLLSVGIKRRSIIVQWHQHAAAQKAHLEAQPAARPAAPAPSPAAAAEGPEGSSYRLPRDLAQVADQAASGTANGLEQMGFQ